VTVLRQVVEGQRWLAPPCRDQIASEPGEAEDPVRVSLGLDLHDGPLQDLALLTADLRLFRDQLGNTVEAHTERERILGRVDDLEARLRAVSSDLRRLSLSQLSPTSLERPFRDALEAELQTVEATAEIRTTLNMDGSIARLSPQQRIVLAWIVRAALSNICKHSGARTVELTVEAVGTSTHLVITDDGCGFDVGETLANPAGAEHIGIVGMATRARLAGGQFRIDSHRGGPTRIQVWLPEEEATGDS
jgi:two-component system nitrate/nitrite sensor histidine kinase NarX